MFQFVKEVLKFSIVGVLSTIITYIAYLFLVKVISPTISYVIAYLLGLLVNYVFNLRYTFKVKTSFKKGLRYIMCHVINLFLNVSLLNMFVSLGISKNMAPIPMYAICIPINFLLVRYVLKRAC